MLETWSIVGAVIGCSGARRLEEQSDDDADDEGTNKAKAGL